MILNFSKITCLIICSFLGVQSLSAQYNINWSSEKNNKIDRNADYKLLGIVGERYYVISDRNENRVLYTFDMNNNLIEDEDWNYFSRDRDYSIQEIITTPQDTFFYIHELSQKHKEWVFYVSRYRDGRFSEPEEIYFEKYDDVARPRLNNMFNDYTTYSSKDGGVLMSPDSSKLAFVNVVMPSDFRQKEIVSVVVWDAGLQELWRASYDFNFANDQFEIKSINLSNNGNVYALAELEKDLDLGKGIVSLRKKNMPRTQYVVYRIDEAGVISENINLDKKSGIVEAGLFFKNMVSDDFIIAGYYSDGTKPNRMSGLFWSQCSSELEHSDIRIHPLEKEVWKDMTHDYVIGEGLIFEKGSIGFVSEYFEVRIVNNNNGFNNGSVFNNGVGLNTFRSYVYYSGELIIPYFNSQGDLVTTYFIQKNYNAPSTISTSYGIAYDGYSYYLVYNDNKRKKQAKETGMKGRLFTDMIVLNSIGEISYDKSMFSEREEDILFSPFFFSTDRDYLTLGGFRRNSLAIGTIKL